MQVEVKGTRLWFDVDGQALVPDGPTMAERPTVVLLHGGPGGFDHSYFKPDFEQLARVAQVVYLDLRGHGRSAWGDPASWGFELCADDVRDFCDALGIARPVVFGHSLGGFVAMLYAARHPGHPGGLVLQSTMARFDMGRLVAEFRRVGGEESPQRSSGSTAATACRCPPRWPRAAGGGRGGRPLHLEGRPRSLLATPHRVRDRGSLIRPAPETPQARVRVLRTRAISRSASRLASDWRLS
jgi:pimeloyl-ACP methyl ester carboxylesterase